MLGDIDPLETPRVARHVRRPDRRDVLLEVEPDLEIGFTLLEPTAGHSERAPTVVGIAQSGARSLLVHRARLVRSLRRRGARVCLVDLRATGPSPGGDEFRGRHARSTIASSAALMLNDPIVAQQLRDLRTILCHLREEARPTRSPLVLWGDSTAAANGPGVPVDVPFDSGPGPELCEPMGPFLALLGGLFENDVRAVYAAGGLIGFRSILDSPFVHVPHDALTPGLLQVADVVDLVNALAPMPLRLEAFVDGRNRPVTAADLDRELGGAPRARRTAARTFAASAARASPTEVARWMIRDETGLPDDSGRPDGSTGNGAIRGPSIRARSP